MAIRNLVGHPPFGRLSVVRQGGRTSDNKVKWWCQCECGSAEIEVKGSSLTAGLTRSCGCFQREKARVVGLANRSHGRTDSSTYSSWESMKTRCTNPKSDNFERYGGRGISICDRWLNSYESFAEDMGERPDGTTIDRIDPNGNYEPGNCRWATTKEQSINKKESVFLEIMGLSMHAQEWSELMGLPLPVIYYRKSHGWNDYDTILTPNRRGK